MGDTNSSLPTYQKALLQVVAYRNIRAVAESTLAKESINTTQWIILGLVNDNSGVLRIIDVAKIIQVEGELITKLVKSLVAAGYIIAGVHARDNRAKLLAITAKGKSFIKRVEPKLASNLSVLESGLALQDLICYFETLKVFINNISPLPDGVI